MKLNTKLLVVGGIALAAIAFIYFMAAVVIPKAMVTLTKAAPATKVSLNDSRVLGQKILCKADGKDGCIVNVYILDKSSKGVSGKAVTLTGDADINPETVSTDKDGKSTFTITSMTEGQVTLKAEVAGMPLSQEVKVTFRN